MPTYTLPGGSSAKGVTYYEKLLGCSRAAHLDHAARASGAGETSEPLAVGTLGHAFIDMHLSGALPGDADPATVNFEPLTHPALANPIWRVEAERVFTWWRGQFPFGLGEFLGAEVDLSAPPALLAQLGIPELTGRLDAVVRLGRDEVDLLAERGVDVTPGVWILDHKFLSAKRGLTKYRLSNQAVAYQLLWDAARDEPCQGFLFNMIIKTKLPQSLLVVRPPPDEHDIRTLVATFKGAMAKEAALPNFPDPTKCVGAFDNVCPHLDSGACPRY